MAVKEIWVDIDGKKIGILKNWRANPLTTAQRNALGATLDSSNESVFVFDTDLDTLFFWDGAAWITFTGTSVNNKVTITSELGESVGGGQLVYLDVSGIAFKFDNSDLSLYGKPVGFTNQSGNIGDTVDIVLAGECDQLGGLTPGDLYYGVSNGLITNIPPVIDIFQPVGVARNAFTLLVNIQKPYIKI